MHAYSHSLITSQSTHISWKHFLAINQFMNQTEHAYPGIQHRFAIHSLDLGIDLMLRAHKHAPFFDIPQIENPDNIPENEILEAAFLDHMKSEMAPDARYQDWLDHMATPPWFHTLRPINPFDHNPQAKLATEFGGIASDYDEIVNVMYLGRKFSSSIFADTALMNSFGVQIVERIVGPLISRTDAQTSIPTQTIAHRLITARWGFIPTLEEFAGRISLKPWMSTNADL